MRTLMRFSALLIGGLVSGAAFWVATWVDPFGLAVAYVAFGVAWMFTAKMVYDLWD